MKICIVGAGAIGGMLAVRFAQQHEVTVIARGATLAAVRAHGLALELESGEVLQARPAATDDPATAGVQDLVIVTVKAHQLPDLATRLLALLDEKTLLVPMQNGIPFWYFHGLPGPFAGRHLEAVDPGGALLRILPLDRVIGSVVYPAAETVAPGRVKLIEGNRFSLGELDGSDSERLRELCRVFVDAGFKAPLQRDLRSEIWIKLWGNATLNPLSALTHATLDVLCGDPLMHECVAALMTEVQQVGEAVGAQFRIPLARRIAGAAAVGTHRTSMLQDVEAGRALELDALLGAVIELGRLTATPTPRLATLYACSALLAREIAVRGAGLQFSAP